MDHKGQIFSASELDKPRGPLSPTERRTLVRLGILKPLRTRSGWAVFGEDDMTAARKWALVKCGGRAVRG